MLGTAAIENPDQMTEITDVFGNQALIVAINFESNASNGIRIESETTQAKVSSLEFIENLAILGVGEILLQSVKRDEFLTGMDFNRISQVSKLTTLPVISSGGAASLDDFHQAVKSGGTAVAAFAIFQFTQVIPM